MKKENAMMRLLSDTSMEAFGSQRQTVYLPRTQIVPEERNREIYYNPRQGELIRSLAQDFHQVGIQQPLIVYREGNVYRILSGHNRFLANEKAMELFADYKGENLPCIIEPTPKTEAERILRLILNNRQRITTGYERMQEIVFYKEAFETIRHYECPREDIRTSLAASNSEITRYLKIAGSLIPPLKEAFRQGQMATSVAHTLATMDEAQQHIIAEAWDFSKAPLTSADVRRLTRKPKEAKEPPPMPSSISDGLTQLLHLSQAVAKAAAALPEEISADQKQAVLKQIAQELEKLEALRTTVWELSQQVQTP